jgi:hypothetical protein
LFKLSKKVVISEFLPKIFILNAVYRDEALGGTNISSLAIVHFNLATKYFNNMVFLFIYIQKRPTLDSRAFDSK